MNKQPKIGHILLTREDRAILERVRRVHRDYVGHTAVVETQDVRDATVMRDLAFARAVMLKAAA